MFIKNKTLRTAKQYPAFQRQEKKRRQIFTVLFISLSLLMAVYVLSGYVHFGLKELFEPITLKMQMIIYPSFFIIIGILTLMRTTRKKSRAKVFLRKEISRIKKIKTEINSQEDKYTAIIRQLIKLTDDSSEENRQNVDKFMSDVTLTDNLTLPKNIILPLKSDKTLKELIGKEINRLFESSNTAIRKSLKKEINLILKKVKKTLKKNST